MSIYGQPHNLFYRLLLEELAVQTGDLQGILTRLGSDRSNLGRHAARPPPAPRRFAGLAPVPRHHARSVRRAFRPAGDCRPAVVRETLQPIPTGTRSRGIYAARSLEIAQPDDRDPEDGVLVPGDDGGKVFRTARQRRRNQNFVGRMGLHRLDIRPFRFNLHPNSPTRRVKGWVWVDFFYEGNVLRQDLVRLINLSLFQNGRNTNEYELVYYVK